MARMITSLLFGLVVVHTLTASVGADEVVRAEEKIRDQLGQATSLDCEVFPLPEILEFLADFHDIEIVLDQPELKRIKLDLGPSQVTKKTKGRLDDTLTEILAPFNLSFMIEGGKLLITSQPKSRAWQERYIIDTGRMK